MSSTETTPNISVETLLNALLEEDWSEAKSQTAIKLIEKHKQNVHFINGTSKVKEITPLMIASRDGLLPIVSILIPLLIEHGCNMNQMDINGNTALMLAAGEGRTSIVKLLIDNGADINIANNAGNTALMFAALDQHQAVVMMLIKNGADKNHKNNLGETALVLAQKIVSFGNIVDWLID